jgi:hypothetical protein
VNDNRDCERPGSLKVQLSTLSGAGFQSYLAWGHLAEDDEAVGADADVAGAGEAVPGGVASSGVEAVDYAEVALVATPSASLTPAAGTSSSTPTPTSSGATRYSAHAAGPLPSMRFPDRHSV